MRDSMLTVFPSVNDLVAGFVIVFMYTVRVIEASHPDAPPMGLAIMADVIMPGLAGSWLFVMAMYAAYVALGEP